MYKLIDGIVLKAFSNFYLSKQVLAYKMKYQSTRGGVKGLSFEEALYTGYAEDGGILLPEEVPKITRDVLQKWSKLSYIELVKEVVALFVSKEEIPTNDLNGTYIYHEQIREEHIVITRYFL